MTHDHVLFQSNQSVLLAAEGSFGENLGGFLKTRGRDETIRLHCSLGDPLEYRFGGGRHLPLLDQCITEITEFMTIDERVWQYVTVSGFNHSHVPHHLTDDRLDMLIVDGHILGQIHPLDLFDEVALYFGHAFDPKDVLGHLVSIGEGLTGNDDVALGDPEVLSGWHNVFVDLAIIGDDVDDRLTTFLLTHLDGAIDLRDHRRILGLANLEDLGNPWQSAGDVLCSSDLSGRFGQ